METIQPRMTIHICTLLSCVLYKNLPFFNLSFDGVVEWHIKHEFYDEMSTKSDVSYAVACMDGAVLYSF